MAEKREFLLGVLMGSAIGAAVALLYAPQAGDNTRHLLRRKANEAKEKATDLAGDVRTSVSETAESTKSRVGSAAESVKHRVADVAGSVKGSTRDLVERGLHAVETKRAQVAAAVEAGKEAYDQKRAELETEVDQDAVKDLPAASSSTDRAPSDPSPAA
jgi:gas vesicle protein